MADYNKTILLTLFIYGLSLAAAELIGCDGKCPDLCKDEFGKKFDQEYRKLHTDMIKKVFTQRIEAMNELSEKLPQDDQHAIVLKDTAATEAADLTKLNENMDKPRELGIIIRRSFADLTTPQLDAKAAHDDHIKLYAEVNEKYHPLKTTTDSLKELMKNTAKLYTDMYGELRDLDKKRYLEYESINNAMKFVQENNENEGIAFKTFYDALEMTAKYFDTPFVDHIHELFE